MQQLVIALLPDAALYSAQSLQLVVGKRLVPGHCWQPLPEDDTVSHPHVE